MKNEDFFLSINNNIFSDKTTIIETELSHEKCELFKDFFLLVHKNIDETFLGDGVYEGLEDMANHFRWCLKKTITHFEEENIFFNENMLFDFLFVFFLYLFYIKPNEETKETREEVIKYIWNIEDLEKKTILDVFYYQYNIMNGALKI